MGQASTPGAAHESDPVRSAAPSGRPHVSPGQRPDRSVSGRPAARLLVVRHGESEWNASGRWQGHADVALTRRGELQAVEASEVLGQFDAIWSSDLARAHRTAQIIAELLGVGPVHTDVRLRETDVGPWEGLTRDEVEAGWPGFLAVRRRPEGFEPYEDAAARMTAALTEIAAEHPGGEVLVVSHGGVIRAALRLVEGSVEGLVEGSVGGQDRVPRLPNLSGSWFELREGRLRRGEIAHLLAGSDDAAEAHEAL